LIFELSSPTLQELGLGPAISEWNELHLANLKLDVEIVDKIKMDRLNLDQNIILFRSVRELLTNILKHARADKISVLLEQDNDNTVVTVSDNGVGFNHEQTIQNVSKEGGLGLFSINERLSELGGSMLISSRMHFGTTTILTIPCKGLEKV